MGPLPWRKTVHQRFATCGMSSTANGRTPEPILTCLQLQRVADLQTTSGKPEFSLCHCRIVDSGNRFHQCEVPDKFENVNVDLQPASRQHRNQEPHLVDRSQDKKLTRLNASP